VTSIDAAYGVDFFIDWHSQMDDTTWANFVYSPSGNTFDSILEAYTDFDIQYPSTAAQGTVDDCTAREWISWNIILNPMYVLEPTPHLYTWTEALLEQQGANVALAINEYFPVAPPVFQIVDSEFDASTDSADLIANSAGQDWYESRNDLQSLLALDTADIGGNTGKKVSLRNYGVANNAYLTQDFSSAQSGTFSVSFDIYIDRIEDNANYDRTGHIYIGGDGLDSFGPCSTANERFVLLAFYDSSPTTDGDVQIRARTSSGTDQTWSNTGLWPTVASGLSYDTWYNVKVVIDYVAGNYDVYVDGVLVASDVSKMNTYGAGAIGFISFAADSAGRGDFYVDNVYSPAP
jgi:hypothetical protein